eukprot:m51a1_g11037 putative glycerol kinase-like isoform x2 (506) ;mRNA; r:431338-433437
MTKLVAALDQGTSSTRVILFNEAGEIAFMHQVAIHSILPQPGWVEEDPAEILETAWQCLEAAGGFVARGEGAYEVCAVGVTNQRETTIAWDRATGKPLHNAVVWLDTRTKDTVDEMVGKAPGQTKDGLRDLCGLPLATYFSALKMKWLLDHVPAVSQAATEGRCLFGNVDSWLIWNLTGGVNGGVHVTDVTNASRTMLMNINTLRWDQTLCDFFGVPEVLLPRIRSSAEIYGRLASGSLLGVPIAACLGDQQAALVGQLCLTPGMAKNTYGTGCFMLLNTGKRAVQSTNGLITTVAYQLGPNTAPSYALEGSVAIAGAGVQWFRDNMCAIRDTVELEELAGAVKDSGGVCVVPAFSGLFAPRWRPDARGAILGLTQFTKRAHVVRALLEATCFQTLEVLNAMHQDSCVELTELRVDGGMTKADVLVQMQADVLGIPTARQAMRETTALGAALAAGIAVGVWCVSNGTVAGISRDVTVFKPTTTEEQRQQSLQRWNKAVERSLNWV